MFYLKKTLVLHLAMFVSNILFSEGNDDVQKVDLPMYNTLHFMDLEYRICYLAMNIM